MAARVEADVATSDLFRHARVVLSERRERVTNRREDGDLAAVGQREVRLVDARVDAAQDERDTPTPFLDPLDPLGSSLRVVADALEDGDLTVLARRVMMPAEFEMALAAVGCLQRHLLRVDIAHTLRDQAATHRREPERGVEPHHRHTTDHLSLSRFAVGIAERLEVLLVEIEDPGGERPGEHGVLLPPAEVEVLVTHELLAGPVPTGVADERGQGTLRLRITHAGVVRSRPPHHAKQELGGDFLQLQARQVRDQIFQRQVFHRSIPLRLIAQNKPNTSVVLGKLPIYFTGLSKTRPSPHASLGTHIRCALPCFQRPYVSSYDRSLFP